MLYKRCAHGSAVWLTCNDPWWAQAKRKPFGRVRVSLEEYYDRPVRGKGAKTLAKDLERQFLLDLRSGKYAAWKAQRGQPNPRLSVSAAVPAHGFRRQPR